MWSDKTQARAGYKATGKGHKPNLKVVCIRWVREKQVLVGVSKQRKFCLSSYSQDS